MHTGITWPHENNEGERGLLSTSEAQRLFMAQFGPEDWAEISALPGFDEAWKQGEVLLAAAIAQAHLIKRNGIGERLSPEGLAAFAAEQRAVEARIAGAKALVAQWAAATGHGGKAGKQSRQSRIRRLIKHGLESEYAKKLRAEIEAARKR